MTIQNTTKSLAIHIAVAAVLLPTALLTLPLLLLLLATLLLQRVLTEARRLVQWLTDWLWMPVLWLSDKTE